MQFEAQEIDLTKKGSANRDQLSKEKWQEILKDLSPDDFGKYKM